MCFSNRGIWSTSATNSAFLLAFVTTPIDSPTQCITGVFRSVVRAALQFIRACAFIIIPVRSRPFALGMYCMSRRNDTTFSICEWWGWSFSVGQCWEFHWPHSWQQCLCSAHDPRQRCIQSAQRSALQLTNKVINKVFLKAVSKSGGKKSL